MVAKLTEQQIAIDAVVSEATVDAIKAEVVRNIESHLESIQEKLDLVADCEKALDLAIELLNNIAASFKEVIEE